MAAPVNNIDIKRLVKIKDILEKYRDEFTEEEKRDLKEFDITIENIIKDKQKHTNKQNDFNKKHKEYHRIINNISHALKVGNQERLEFWKNKLKEYKEANK